jgi:hypothetical protein
MTLMHPRPCLPAWEGLPEACREELVAVLAHVMRERIRVLAHTNGKEQPDE